MSKPNFSARPVAPPPAAGPKHNPNGPPLAKGATYVADDTANQLKMVGWNPGDDIPDGLADHVAEVAAKYADAKSEIAAVGGTNRLKAPKTVRIEDLPEEARKEITAFVKQAAALKAAEAADVAARGKYAAPPGASDSVRAALEQASLRDSAKPAAVAIVPEDDEMEPSPEKPQEGPPHVHTAPADPLTPVICPRCNFDLRQPYDVVITDDDLMAYAAANLDPVPTARFRKKLDIMGGKLQVVFRDLLTRESKLAVTQLRRDALAGKISSEVEAHMTHTEYRMVMSIERITDASGAVLAEVPPIFEIEIDPAEADNRLPKLVDYMDGEAYPRETIKRAILTHFRQFQRLVVELEAKMRDPDFCQGIETSLSW